MDKDQMIDKKSLKAKINGINGIMQFGARMIEEKSTNSAVVVAKLDWLKKEIAKHVKQAVDFIDESDE